MSVFSNILDKIFHRPAQAQPGATPGPTASDTPPTSSGTSASASASSTPTTTAASGPVDVEAVLSRMPNSQSLNWRTSIVDLMKLVGLDSSLAARKQLAQELHYSGDLNDSATMNQWLHKQVMRQLAENGGKLPAELHA